MSDTSDRSRVYFEEDAERDGFSVYDGGEWLANFKRTGHAVAFAELVRFFVQGLDEWGTPEARMRMLAGQFNLAADEQSN
jgi:hypothetical protein